MHAEGTFEVQVKPIAAYNEADPSLIGRMSIDKQWSGAFSGTSLGEMLTGMGALKGSAGYVAIERVTGTLDGLNGSFTLMHTGTMTRGAPHLAIIVVPDSGTGDLAGLTGTLNIVIAGGAHSYEFDYTLAPAP